MKDILEREVFRTSMSGNQIDASEWEGGTKVLIVKADRSVVLACPPVETIKLREGQIAIIVEVSE